MYTARHLRRRLMMASRKSRSSSSVRSPISTSSSGGRGRAALRTCSLPRSRVVPPEPVPCASASDTAAPAPMNQATRREQPDQMSPRSGHALSTRESLGVNRGSQHLQIHLHRSRPSRTVAAGGRLPARLPQTGSGAGLVPGGQGVAGPRTSSVIAGYWCPMSASRMSHRDTASVMALVKLVQGQYGLHGSGRSPGCRPAMPWLICIPRWALGCHSYRRADVGAWLLVRHHSQPCGGGRDMANLEAAGSIICFLRILDGEKFPVTRIDGISRYAPASNRLYRCGRGLA